ncbi:MAG: PEP-CTERM sorting domain-containing protein [Planctomycetia bacterium]|nr:PEP-CTERM sorting domain-containing protein [Planctomycetia bacterium]
MRRLPATGLTVIALFMCVSVASAATVVVSPGNEVRLYDDTLTTLRASLTPTETVTDVKFLSNGYLAVATTTQLQLYHGYDLSPIGSATMFAGGVSKILPMANGNYAVAGEQAGASVNHGVWMYNGTTGGLISENVNWEAPVNHLIETKTGNVAFAVDQAGYGGGSIIMLNGSNGAVMGYEPGWGDIRTFSAMDGGRGDVLFTATQDNRYGKVYPNTWGTINGTTGGYASSNPNWAYVPTVGGTANGQVVWNGVDAGKSLLYRSTADGVLLNSPGVHFATEPLSQMVELANGNIGLSLMYAAPGSPLKGEAWISNGNFTAFYNSNAGWQDEPIIAAVPNADGDMLMCAVDGSLKWAGLFDGSNMKHIIAAKSGVGAEVGEIIALPNGNMFFASTGEVDLVTSGTEEGGVPRFLPDAGFDGMPMIGGYEDNYILHAGYASSAGVWVVYAGSGTGAATAPYDIGGFAEAGNGPPLAMDHTPVNVVPEPASIVLICLGFLTLVCRTRRRAD